MGMVHDAAVLVEPTVAIHFVRCPPVARKVRKDSTRRLEVGGCGGGGLDDDMVGEDLQAVLCVDLGGAAEVEEHL